MVKGESESNAGGGGTKGLQVSRDSTCGSFMSQPSDDPAEQQRLISKRWSLKHDQTLETFGMRDQVQQQLTQKPNMMRDITNVPRVQKLTNLPATGSKTAANPPAPDTIPLTSADICNSFKKLSKAKNIRKRPTVEEGVKEDAEGECSVVHMKKKAAVASNKLYFSTGPPKCNKASSFYFESPKEITVQNDSRATASLETETEFSKDARAIRERVLKLAEEALKGKSKSNGDEKLYKGMNRYTDYKAGLRREHTISSEKACGAHGPLRASAYIRVSTRFDYQPDICKDYKETGYCGYGDACKFLHDRGDYKSGWQLEKEWEEAAKERKRKLAMGVLDEDDVDAEKSDEDDDDSLPFACYICRQPYVDPVVTKCKHYFCVRCALKHHAKNKKCFVCNQPTLGIFNTTFEIRKKMVVQGK